MKRLFLLATLALALPAAGHAQMGATQTFMVDKASLALTLPKEWIQMPEGALTRFRNHPTEFAPNIKAACVAGFAGPRTNPNGPLTLLLVQVCPRELTPELYASALKPAKESKAGELIPTVSEELGAAIVPVRTQGTSSRKTYVFPTTKSVILLDLYCAAENADPIARTIDSSLKQLTFATGVEKDAKWLEGFRSVAK